jgi:hypothetical protein
MMKKCTGRSRILVQENVFKATIGMADKMEKRKRKRPRPSGWSYLEVKCLVQGFVVAQETLPLKNSPSKNNVFMLTTMSISHPCLKFLTKKVLVVV